MRHGSLMAIVAALIAILVVGALAGCSGQQSGQVGPPVVIQPQIMPIDSENARPAHAESAQASSSASGSKRNDPYRGRAVWRGNTVRVTITASSSGGDQSQTPEQSQRMRGAAQLNPAITGQGAATSESSAAPDASGDDSEGGGE